MRGRLGQRLRLPPRRQGPWRSGAPGAGAGARPRRRPRRSPRSYAGCSPLRNSPHSVAPVRSRDSTDATHGPDEVRLTLGRDRIRRAYHHRPESAPVSKAHSWDRAGQRCCRSMRDVSTRGQKRTRHRACGHQPGGDEEGEPEPEGVGRPRPTRRPQGLARQRAPFGRRTALVRGPRPAGRAGATCSPSPACRPTPSRSGAGRSRPRTVERNKMTARRAAAKNPAGQPDEGVGRQPGAHLSKARRRPRWRRPRAPRATARSRRRRAPGAGSPPGATAPKARWPGPGRALPEARSGGRPGRSGRSGRPPAAPTRTAQAAGA